MVHRCLGRQAPSYLADYCVPVSTVPGRQHLRSASRRQLIVPRVRRSTFGARAFAIAGPTVWNSLPDSLRDPAVGPDQFWRDLKTHLFEWHCVSFSALAVFSRNALYKSTFYLLTYKYLLHSSLRHCQLTPAKLGQSTSPVCATLPPQYLRSSSLLCCRPDGLELYRTVSETRLSAAAAASDNYLRRTCSTATQCSQDAAVTLRYVDVQLTFTLILTGWLCCGG